MSNSTARANHRPIDLMLAVMRAPGPLLRLLAGPPRSVDGQALEPHTRLFLRILSLDKAGRHEQPYLVQRQNLDYLTHRATKVGHPVETRELTVPGVGVQLPARLYRPLNSPQALPGLLYLHGGGFTIGSVNSHDNLCRRLAHEASCVVVSLDYRLAPEARFPAAVDDSFAGLRWLSAQAETLGIDPERLAIGGDSAGGNLSAVVAHMATQSRTVKLRAQLLIYPATDARLNTESMRLFAKGYYLSADHVRWFLENYLGPEMAQVLDPRVSPVLYEDLRGLPPALVVTAGLDPLRDEGRAYAQRLREAKVPVQYLEMPGLVHGFLNLTGVLPEADRGVAQLTEALKRSLHEDAMSP